ncbi:MAG: molecular chaperone Tir [Desulfotalea sp.]|nr:MAG: molecular chaperone Tir [Desulfotalea sp.]
MKVFINHSGRDKKFTTRLAEALNKAGIETWVDKFEINTGDNLFQKIQDGIKECDYIIVILSKNYTQSSWTKKHLNAFAMQEVSNNKNTILPVLIEDCDIPIFLQDRLYADFRNGFDGPIRQLIDAIKGQDQSRTSAIVSQEVKYARKKTTNQKHIKHLKNYLRAGELSLVCGAGVSVGAGVPDWSSMLHELLSNLFRKQLKDNDSSIGDREKLAALYQEYFNPSPLVVAQYLKNGLGDDFLENVRDSLYRNSPTNSSLIESIMELCRPQRSRQALQSIISFNFDDLIEQNLKAQHIQFKSIFSEGQKTLRSELPIYHVHGYLPRGGDITNENHIVFSEDAYHSQFIDPFSWSNLVQLNHFSQNVCIFIGLSMTDPNLRRLLDVSMRKNPARLANHYFFKKRHDSKNLNNRIANIDIEGLDAQGATDFIKIAEMLEEQDANNLGLNIIWIDQYEEIPEFLLKLSIESDR